MQQDSTQSNSTNSPPLKEQPNWVYAKENNCSTGPCSEKIIEGVKANKLLAFVTFIDFKKAFDSVHRDRMIYILTAYGIPKKLVNTIRLSYSDTRAIVTTPYGITDDFEITAGVL